MRENFLTLKFDEFFDLKFLVEQTHLLVLQDEHQHNRESHEHMQDLYSKCADVYAHEKCATQGLESEVKFQTLADRSTTICSKQQILEAVN